MRTADWPEFKYRWICPVGEPLVWITLFSRAAGGFELFFFPPPCVLIQLHGTCPGWRDLWRPGGATRAVLFFHCRWLYRLSSFQQPRRRKEWLLWTACVIHRHKGWTADCFVRDWKRLLGKMSGGGGGVGGGCWRKESQWSNREHWDSLCSEILHEIFDGGVRKQKAGWRGEWAKGQTGYTACWWGVCVRVWVCVCVCVTAAWGLTGCSGGGRDSWLLSIQNQIRSRLITGSQTHRLYCLGSDEKCHHMIRRRERSHLRRHTEVQQRQDIKRAWQMAKNATGLLI